MGAGLRPAGKPPDSPPDPTLLRALHLYIPTVKFHPHCVLTRLAVRFLLHILTREAAMLVTDKGQVTIPKHIRLAAGVAPGSEVTFSLEGSRIVITPVGTGVKEDRRLKLRAAAARVRGSFNLEFKQLSADEIMTFIRGDEPPKAAGRRGSR